MSGVRTHSVDRFSQWRVSWYSVVTLVLAIDLTNGICDMDEKERAEQVRRAAQGDPDALQRLIVHYHGALFGTIDARMDAGLRRHGDPDDVLQEAYITAFRVIRSCEFHGPDAFYRWLERIALDRLRDFERMLRRKKRDIGRQLTGRRAGGTSYADLVERLTSPGTSPSRRLAKREASAAVISSMAQLTDDQRAVVRMVFLEGMPVAEIAAELGKSEDAVYAHSHRGLKALRKLMASITDYLSRL